MQNKINIGNVLCSNIIWAPNWKTQCVCNINIQLKITTFYVDLGMLVYNEVILSDFLLLCCQLYPVSSLLLSAFGIFCLSSCF